MDLAQRVVELETKLNNTIELLRTIVLFDRGFDTETTDYFIEELNKLQQEINYVFYNYLY